MAAEDVAPCDPTVLAWALIAVGQLVGMRWIVWDHRDAIPSGIFDECMVVVARMLGHVPRGERPAPTPA